MKKLIFLTILITSLIFIYCSRTTKKNAAPEKTADEVPGNTDQVTSNSFRKGFNIIVVSDWGWNGYRHQQEVADQMARTADSIDLKFIATCGDNFQVSGVASVMDPLWLTSYENVYRDLSLHKEWFPVLGNHDYKGNTQAEIDYSHISRRWRMTDRYYSFSKKINDSISACFIFIDTPPLVTDYHRRSAEYPDIARQDTAREREWLIKVLSGSKDQWKIVFGHHPVYSASQKHGNTPELIRLIKPLLEKYHAQVYICGHDHDFQHLREGNKSVDYIVTGTGGEVRNSHSNEMSLFSGSGPGFSVVSFKGDSMRIAFVNSGGNIIYSFGRSYRF